MSRRKGGEVLEPKKSYDTKNRNYYLCTTDISAQREVILLLVSYIKKDFIKDFDQYNRSISLLVKDRLGKGREVLYTFFF